VILDFRQEAMENNLFRGRQTARIEPYFPWRAPSHALMTGA